MLKKTLLIVLFTSISGCSENISNQIDVAESDLNHLVAYGSVQPTDGAKRVMSKPSFYVTRVAYEGESAKSMLRDFRQYAERLGYEKEVKGNPKTLVFCHRTESGRYFWMETVREYPLVVSVGVTVSGHDRDRKKCESADISG